jgi:hypothetical protein
MWPAGIDRCAAILDAIAARRAACDDPALELLPDDLLGGLNYVLAQRGVPRAVLAEDAMDALRLISLLLPLADQLQHGAIGLAKDAGLTWDLIGQLLGLGPGRPQAAEQRYLRLKAKLADEPSDATLGRRVRRREQAERSPARRRAEQARLRRQAAWLAQPKVQTELEAAASAVVNLALLSPAAQDSADELALELRNAELRHTSPDHRQLYIWLRTLMYELSSTDQLAAIPEPVRASVAQLTAGWDRASSGHSRTSPAAQPIQQAG